jgi:hypothetical protein
VHFTTEFSPFEIVYGFNLFNSHSFDSFVVDETVNLDNNHKSQVMKTLHESVQQQIKKRNRV